MPSVLPDGEPVPADGALPPGVGLGERGFGAYVHVPFCATRCGYCDFNTYTADEATSAGYVDALLAEIALAARVVEPRPLNTVFFGGGTPTLLPVADLARVLDALRATFGLAPDAEVTTEANPETVDLDSLKQLREAGFTRISLGMQSTAPHVLRVLERRHTPGRAIEAATQARAAGFAHVNLDLIYGTPGETETDFEASLRAVVDAGVDHVSAYALIVEDGTRLAARVRRGELPMPDDDVAADRYEQADTFLSTAGFSWYEVSNFARTPIDACQHNLLYWRGGDWWGFGPGAHSHVDGVRWWNVKHPAAYAARLAAGTSPGAGREILTPAERHEEEVLLLTRLATGVPLALVPPVDTLVSDGLLTLADDRAILTRRGRLLADVVVRHLTR